MISGMFSSGRRRRRSRSRFVARDGDLDDRALRRIGLVTLAVAALCVLTILVFTQMERHAGSGVSLLRNADFQSGFEAWALEGIVTLDEFEVGRAILQNRDPAQVVYLRQQVPTPIGHNSLELTLEVATRNVVPGSGPPAGARVYLDAGHLAVAPLQVRFVGTTGRHRLNRQIDLPPGSGTATLGIELRQATGQVDVAGIELRALAGLPSFRLAASLLVAGWCLVAVYAALSVIRSIHGAGVRLLAAGTGAVALLIVFIPWRVRESVIAELLSGFGFALDPNVVGHLAVFALFAFLIRVGRRRDQLQIHLSCWCLVAAATEVVQLITVGGDPSTLGWLADLAGVVFGLIAAELAIRLDTYVNRRSSPGPQPDGTSLPS